MAGPPESQQRRGRAQPPRFLMAPRSKTVPEGSHVRFLCLVSGEPQPRVRYTHDGKDPKDATVTYLQDNFCCLDMGAVRPEHAGLYRVELSNPSGIVCVETHLEVTSKETKVVPAAPKVLVPLRDTIVEDGQPFTLSCEVSGQPPPSVVWSRDGVPLAPSSQDFQVILDGSGTILLLVREAFPEDNARFACRLRNPSGEATTSCIVTVQGVKTPALQDVRNAGSEHMEKQNNLQAALVNGNSRFAPDRSAPVKRRNQLRLPETDGAACLSLLPISTCSSGMKRRNNTSLQARSADHAYSVLCPFLLGNLELPLWLKQHVARLSTNSCYARMPVRTTVSLPRTIQNCVQICLQLLSSGALTPAMNATFSVPDWYRNRQHARRLFAITASESDAQILTDSVPPRVPQYFGFLHLSSDSTGLVPDIIFSSDASSSKNTQIGTQTSSDNHSEQTCTRVLRDTNFSGPEQPLSNAHSTNCRKRPPADLLPPEHYEVHSPTPLDDGELVPAQIIHGPQSIVTQVGADVRLSVRFVGVPAPKVTWIRAGKIVVEDGSVSVQYGDHSSKLCIHGASCDDSGKYLVVVENRCGCDCDYASLKVEGPPDPPVMEPRAVAKSATSVEITWSGSPFDGGCQILRYLVDMAEVDGGPRMWSRVSSELSTSCVVTGLTPGISYTFVVRAENVRGIGDPTAESNVVTLPVDGWDDTEDSDSDEPVAPAEAPVIVQQASMFQDLYDLHEEVGKGRFGTVHRCTRKSDNSEAAAKIVSCIRIVQRDKVLDEIAVMNLLRGHPKLLNLQAAFERPCEKPRQMILVTEFVSGGELFERVIADDFVLTERDCVLFVRQICIGVAYMHQKRVVHLDLKPENILCQSKNSHKIKLIDFGLAQKYDPEGDLKVLFGTPEFVAPEVVNYERISPATDMWSVGVICYVLLSGLSPFMGDTDAETYSNIIKVDYDFDDEVFEKISDTAKDFIQKLLIKNPQKRLSAQQCLEHEWLKKVPRITSVPLPTEKLKKFVIRRKWLKTGNAIMALGRMVNLTSINSSPTKQDDPQLLDRPAPNGSLDCRDDSAKEPQTSEPPPPCLELSPRHMSK